MTTRAATPRRAVRSDAARNRQAVLDAATRTFAMSEAEPSVRAIAAAAGVGLGTIYRHFPTREALVDAVYRDQVERLVSGARQLLAELPPDEALRRWMDLFADWVATKRGMLRTMLAMIEAGAIQHAETREILHATAAEILIAGAAAGSIRAEVSADDLVAGMLGILTVTPAPHQHDQAARLLDLLWDGMRVRR